ncbi:MAG: FAD-dependent oxidoreductase [Betaproteobacteria bacterium]|nr:FAD-dependent oxidoreductase [Betaproteobacteria bacterium]
MTTNRRQFIQMAAAGAAGLALPGWALGAPAVPTTGPSGRVVVVGGGMAGATVAKYLRLWGGTRLEVTLIDRSATYVSCVLSNLVLTDAVKMTRLQFTYAALAKNYGIQVVTGEVAAIDPVSKRVALTNGAAYPYDRMVLAPGVEFDTYLGLDSAAAKAKVVHAWKAGPETTTLRNQLVAMKAGGVFLMSIPPAPYRCPPGPYERACVVADYLKRKKPKSKLILLDANAGITAEKASFTRAFTVTHAGVIDYRPGVTINEIDATTLTVKTSAGDIKANVINPIPPHRAGALAAATGVVDVNGRWAGVDVLSYESTAMPGIHVIGDASATTQPKAGHIANQEARVCADAIVRLLSGLAPDPAPVTNSACYSPITANTASWLSVVFQYDAASRTMKAAGGGVMEAEVATKKNYEQMFKWYGNLMGDTFA